MSCCFSKKANTSISIQSSANSISDIGTPIKTWSTSIEPYAIVEPKTVNEVLQNGQLISKTVYKITIRYYAELNANQRIILNSKNINIIGFKHLARDMTNFGYEYSEITAIEGEIS